MYKLKYCALQCLQRYNLVIDEVYFLKRLFVGCLIAIACATIVGIWASRDTLPSHTVLRQSNLPPLIPTRAFFADPRSEFAYIASSDGAYTASQKASLLGQQIVVKELATGEQIASFPLGISDVRWHPTKTRLRIVFEGQAREVDPFRPERKNWLRISPIKLSGGWSLSEFATDPKAPLLYWGSSRQGEQWHMWHVSQDGLTAQKIAEGNSQTQYWIADETGQLPLRVDAIDPSTHRIFRHRESDWEALIDIKLNDTFQILGRIDETGVVLARSSRGRDKVALVSFDTQTGQETLILENTDSDIALTTHLSYNDGPDVIRLGFDTLDRVALTENGQTLLDILDQFPQPIILGDTSPTASGRFVTQAISPQGKSWLYLLIDLKEKTFKTLGEYHFRRFKGSIVQERAITFRARDGLDIPAIIAMPEEVSGPIPFVVSIHGGPADIAHLHYDHSKQFLVNRGYGVLSVNFRGSIGFGKEFMAKGFKEFGRAMQDDIADAANWLIDMKLADPDALIAMGISYGGYAAAMAMTRDPNLFDAAIVEFPMLDVEFQTRYHPGFWTDNIGLWSRYFGEIDNPEDVKQMQLYSPVNRVDDIHGPLLVLAGLRDQITDVRQVQDFEERASLAGKEVDFHYFPNAGHGVQTWHEYLKRGRLIEDFLADHVGGRSGGFEFLEWAPSFIQ